MEYRLSLTPRLIALAIFSGVALLILLFTLGFQIGQRMAKPATPSIGTLGMEARERAAAAQQASGKVSNFAASAAKPLADPAVLKAAP
jgi:hypothetical protein